MAGSEKDEGVHQNSIKKCLARIFCAFQLPKKPCLMPCRLRCDLVCHELEESRSSTRSMTHQRNICMILLVLSSKPLVMLAIIIIALEPIISIHSLQRQSHTLHISGTAAPCTENDTSRHHTDSSHSSCHRRLVCR
jgi:hypothetical protein